MHKKLNLIPIVFALALVGGGLYFSTQKPQETQAAFTHPVYHYSFDYPGEIYCAERLNNSLVVSCSKGLDDPYNPYGIDVFTQQVDDQWTLDTYMENEVANLNNNPSVTIRQILILDDNELVDGYDSVRFKVDFTENDLKKEFYTEQVAFLKDRQMYAIQYNTHDPEKPNLEGFNAMVKSFMFN